jgi:hypothetical protein
LLRFIPGTVGQVAFGKYDSPDYETAEQFIPPVGTRTGTPVVQGVNEVFFNLYLPSGPRPAGGWPVAIFGHGFGDNRLNSPYVVAASMAERGIATIAINVVGHGGGPLGTLVVNRAGGLPPVTLPAPGRGIDQNGDTNIDSTEGSGAAAPRTLIGSADGLRQTVIDLMQLVRQIQVLEVGAQIQESVVGQAIQEKILKLNEERTKYVAEEMKKKVGDKKDSLDRVMAAAAKEQAEKKSFEVKY